MKKHLCIVFTFIVLVGAYIEEIDLPESFTECLEKQRIKNLGAATGEAMSKWCMNSHRMKLTGDKFKHSNVSEDTVSWINELLRMSNVDMKLDLSSTNSPSHSVKKRQASLETPSLYPNVQFPPQPIIDSDSSDSSNTLNSQGPEYLSETLQSFSNQHTGSGQAQRFQPGQARPFPIIGGENQATAAQQPAIQTQQFGAAIPQTQQFAAAIPQQTFSGGSNQPIQAQVPLTQINPVQTQFSQQQQQQQQTVFQQPSQQINNFVPAQQQPTFAQGQQQSFQSMNAFQPQLQPQPTVMSPNMNTAQPVSGIPVVQRPQLRIRKEYRTMTDQERANFHRAILLLKQDTVSTIKSFDPPPQPHEKSGKWMIYLMCKRFIAEIRKVYFFPILHKIILHFFSFQTILPNRYDALGLVHFRMVDNIHHGGAFLAWHRIFITM